MPKTSRAVAVCTSSPRMKISLQHVLVGDVREHAQLDLRVVGASSTSPGLGHEAAADLAPQRRCGPGCSAGSGSSRQAAGRRRSPGMNVVCSRPSLVDQRGQRVEVGLGELVELAPALDLAGRSRARRGSPGARARRSRSRSCRAACFDRPSLSNSTSPSCCGEPIMNSSPASSQISRSSSAASSRDARARSRRAGRCRARTPATSIVAQHAHERQLDRRRSSASRPRSAICSRCAGRRARGRARRRAPRSSSTSTPIPRSSASSSNGYAAPRRVEQVGARQRVVGELGAGPSPSDLASCAITGRSPSARDQLGRRRRARPPAPRRRRRRRSASGVARGEQLALGQPRARGATSASGVAGQARATSAGRASRTARRARRAVGRAAGAAASAIASASSRRRSGSRSSNSRNTSRSRERSGSRAASSSRSSVDRDVALHRRELLGDRARRRRASRRFSLRLAPEISSTCARTPSSVAELLQQLRGGLVADARDARDVVGRVALEPEEVGDQLRRDPVALDHGLRGRRAWCR